MFLAFLALTVLLRLVPHPGNFSPIVPVCLFGAAMVSSKRLALVAPLASWLVGDLALGLLHRDMGWAFYPGQAFTYAAFAVCVACGFLLRERAAVGPIVGVGLLSAVAFFLVSNFGAWMADPIYAKTPAGLANCYVAGLPFFRWTLLSQVVFLPILFSPLTVRPVARVASAEVGT